ncbi:Aconitate hydratase [compost metagenome]
MTVAAVISGNRNFEGRVHAQVKANYLASPPLVVAYALAGTVNIDLQTEPLGYDPQGEPVFLKDIWPTSAEIREAIGVSLSPEMFRRKYENVFTANERWNAIPVPEGELYEWDDNSTYIQNPPFFENLADGIGDIKLPTISHQPGISPLPVQPENICAVTVWNGLTSTPTAHAAGITK